MENETALIEAILFLETEPIDVVRLVKISRLSRPIVETLLDILREKYSQEDSGLELFEDSGAYVLIPNRRLSESLKANYGKRTDDKISRAALETLSIIAYSQPLTRIEIENIRGVGCSGVLKILQEKGFIQEVGRKEAPGRPVQYGTTKDFLKQFGLASIADLPKLDGAERDRFELKET